MTALRLALIALTAAWPQIGATQTAPDAEDLASEAWQKPRADVIVRLCGGTAPSFEGFAKRAGELKLTAQADGTYHLAPDLYATLVSADGKCVCRVTFASGNAEAAAAAIGSRLVALRDLKVAAHDDPDVFAQLRHRGAQTLIRLGQQELDGNNWFHAAFFGPAACPQTSQ